jgi:hypothetical protein
MHQIRTPTHANFPFCPDDRITVKMKTEAGKGHPQLIMEYVACSSSHSQRYGRRDGKGKWKICPISTLPLDHQTPSPKTTLENKK